ncbi:MAG: hypothetical protein HND52_15355 [Ignavibacteriae bacterium]|nr:hypothetical protein [Ignavibacteriota bacterium]NOG99332.1 hypothetical protein [Ignavibacteriota bacterium]
MEDIKVNATVNFIRGFLKLLQLDGIGDMIFALKDARADQMVEDSFNFFEERLTEISISQLKSEKEIINKIEELGDKKDSLIKDYILFLRQREFINENKFDQIFNIILSSKAKIDKVDKTTEEIKESTQEIKKILSERIENSEVFNGLIEKQLKHFTNRINDFYLEESLQEINDIQSLSGYSKINKDIILSIKSLEGTIYIKKYRFEKAEEIVKILLHENIYNERICNFLVNYATIKKDEKLKDNILNEFRKLEVKHEKILLKEANFYFISKNYRKAQTILAYEKDGKILIKNELIESDDSYYLLGMIKFYEKEYISAENYLKIAISKKNTLVAKFHHILARAFHLIDKKFAVHTLSDEDRAKLRTLYDELSNSEYRDKRFLKIPQLAEEYWGQRLSILLHINSKEALDELLKIDSSIKNLRSIQQIEADILFFNGEHEKAKSILLDIYKVENDKNLLSKILGSFIILKSFDEAKTFFEGLSEEDYDSEGILASLYLDALKEITNSDNLIHKADEFCKSLTEPIYIYKFLGEYYYQQNKIEFSKKYYTLCINTISIPDYPPRILFARDLFEKKFYSIAFNCLRPMINDDYSAKKLFVSKAIRYGDEEDINISAEIIDEELKSNYDYNFWYSAKADMEYNRNRFYTALKFIEKLFHDNKTEDNAYRYAYLKLMINSKEYGEELRILESSENEDYLMIAATCYNVIGNQTKCEFLSLIALAKTGSFDNNNLYAQFIQLHLFRNPDEDKKVEFDEVNSDCTILLSSVNEEFWIGITSNNDILIERNNFIFVDTLFYSKRNEKIIQLNGAKKNDEVLYQGEKYIIKEIWAINTRAIRFILNYFDNPANEMGFMKKVSVNMDDPLESMKPMLVELELHEKNMLSMYNLSNQIGLSLNLLARGKGRNILDVIIYLLNLPNQPFFAGEINNYDLEHSDFILAPSSIVILSLLELIDDVTNHHKNCSITQSTYDYFKDIITQFDEFEKRSNMSIGIDEGNVNVNSIDDFSQKNRRKFFVDLVNTLSKLNRVNVESTAEELDDNRMLITLASKPDYDTLKQCNSLNSVHVSDDLVVRKLRGFIGKNIRSTNSISVIYSLFKDDLVTLIDLIEKLSKSKYTYSFNLNIILNIISGLLRDYRIVGSSSFYDKAINIIHNSLTVPVTFNEQMNLLLSIFNFLYTHRFTPNADYLIEQLLRTVSLFVSLYNVDERIFQDYLLLIVGDDPEKVGYFSKIFRSL